MSEIINQLACVVLIITLPPFFKVINKSKVLLNEPYIDRFFINTALFLLFAGSLNGITDTEVSFSSVLIRLGLAMVFVWGYFFHKSKK